MFKKLRYIFTCLLLLSKSSIYPLEYNQNVNINGLNGYVLGSKLNKATLDGLQVLNKHPWFTPTWCFRVRERCTSYKVMAKKLSLFNIESQQAWLLYHDKKLTGIYVEFPKKNQTFTKLTNLLRTKYISEKFYNLGDFKELYIDSVNIDLKIDSYSNILRLEDKKSINKFLRDELKQSKEWRDTLNTDMHYERIEEPIAIEFDPKAKK
ncbi:MAG: hypothetical protein KC646_05050 [Candidatus Cloacimonetes bacterium]|nr:hypothetical protein [Candidatus Cloacimonadota bacterium]